MKRKFGAMSIVLLAVVGLAVVAYAAAPVVAACCGGCGGCGDKNKDGAKGPSASDGPTTAPADQNCVNTKCPIMGGKIDPANVPAKLTRMFKGQKVGFCCGGCPAKWDKLTDEQKEAKLNAVK